MLSVYTLLGIIFFYSSLVVYVTSLTLKSFWTDLTKRSALHPEVNQIVNFHERRQAAAGGVGGAVATQATSAAPTLVYVATTVAGVVKTVEISYVQTFSPAAVVAQAVSSGTIALPTGAAASATAASDATHIAMSKSRSGIFLGLLGLFGSAFLVL